MSATANPAAATPKFEFDSEFQGKIAQLALRDTAFLQLTDGLIKPEYLENEIDAVLVGIVLGYFEKYKAAPTGAALTALIKDARTSKIVRADMDRDFLVRVKELLSAALDVTDRAFIVDKIASFAKQQAMTNAVLEAAELLDNVKLGDARFVKIDEVYTKAKLVGTTQDASRYDFWGNVTGREKNRHDRMAGLIKPTGITTGFKEIDDLLYHKGWGRGELTVLMGPAKSGKSMGLVTFGAQAALHKKNVLLVTLEVSQEIMAMRLDANLANTAMRDLDSHMALVRDRVQTMRDDGAGDLVIHGFPSGSFAPGDLRRLLHRYRSQGVNFDLVIVDYADLMRPDVLTREPIENSRLIYIDLRAIAQEFDVAMLSATQTNREGFKATVGRMEHVASDINKVRTVDLLISLNQTEDEKADGKARLHFAASRNQESGKTVLVKCDFAKASYIKQVLGVE